MSNIIILDPAHGYNVAGKCSPDGAFYEYLWSREICNRLGAALNALGYRVEYSVLGAKEPSLKVRCQRINDFVREHKTDNILGISVHVNAAGADGGWHDARGFSVFVSPNASARSKKFAKIICDEAIESGLRGNRCVPVERYWVQNLAMCRDTSCPFVLTENLFMDNKLDLDFLMSEEGKNAIVNLHLKAIKKYFGE